ncbi:MAG: hypothetical protein AAFR81_26135 [Chloroflexota bacterium]
MRRYILFIALLLSVNAVFVLVSQFVGSLNTSGGMIAYTLSERMTATGSTIMLIDPHTGVRINASIGITDDVANTNTREPRWSVDGTQLSFRLYAGRQASPVNYALQISDNTYTNLSEQDPYLSLPIYGPNDQRLYSTNPLFGTGVLYRVGGDVPDGEAIATVQTASRDLPVWSPDGTQIAYLSEYQELDTDTQPSSGTSLQEIDIYIYDILTDETLNYTLALNTSGQMAWSPDGETIAFISRTQNVGQIYLLDVDSGDITELPPRTEAVGRPVWSSDSRMIAFTSENWDRISDISTDVMVIDVETHDVTNLSQSGAFDNSPIWSPDNRYVVFISMRDGQSELYVADIQTGNLRRLTYTPENEGDITWQPRP